MMRLLVSTYTGQLAHVTGRGPGIVAAAFDHSTGTWRETGAPLPIRDPAYLWLNTAGDRLYATSEICDFAERPDGCVTVIAVDPATGVLAHRQTVSSAGAGPAYVRGDRTGRWLLVANYVAGSVAVLPIAPDGTLGAPACVIPHQGCGPEPTRQEGPHPHAIIASADNRFVYVADLGADVLVGYAFDATTGQLAPAPRASFTLPPGGGPRHFLFDPAGRQLFVMLELSSQVAVLQQSPKDGALSLTDLRSTLPAGWHGSSHGAELALTGDGRCLYVSNRGHDSLAGFRVDETAGRLVPIGHWPSGGVTPRHFALAEQDRLLLVANQDSNSITAFRRDPGSGALTILPGRLKVATPCFVLAL